MKFASFISYVLTETPKLKEFFSYVKDYKYRKFFINQVYLFFQPLNNIYKNIMMKKQINHTVEKLEMPQVTFEVINSLLAVRLKPYDFTQNKKCIINENKHFEDDTTYFLPLVNQELLLNRMRRAVA
jgi:hypothetical protein